uniref:DOMON domain-containing protein n=1 Tax=Strigamia maritima TaxID=126957 RepID=T1ISN0_STRMM
MDYVISVVLLVVINYTSVAAQYEDSEDGRETYYGKLLGRFNTFSHQVDGDGKDTYFWVGSSNHADRRAGYAVPDEGRKTNVLKRYANSELTLTLPDNKKIDDLKWFAIYDIGSSTTFADVKFPEDFEPPGRRLLSEFTRNSNGVKSDPILAVDSKTLIFTNFNYDGLSQDAYFWVGAGPVPNSKGTKIPDENGYLESLRPYQAANITLHLPGNMTIFDIDWLSVFNVVSLENYGSLLFPKELNVPPSLDRSVVYYSQLPNCEQLHEKLQINWMVNSPPTKIEIEIVGKIGENDYMAFGVNENGFGMIESRVAVAAMNNSKPIVDDYQLKSKTPCMPVPKGTSTEYDGVCPTSFYEKKPTDIKNIKGVRFEDVTIINFTLSLPPDGIVDPFKLSEDVHIVWAIGHLNNKYEPLYHYLRNTGDIKLTFDRQPSIRRCFDFISGKRKINSWKTLYIANPHLFKFNFTLGPSGGPKGYEGITGHPSPGLAWYVNGLLAPELYLKRGQKYIFSIEGGDNILQPAFHHPFYISDDPEGGYETLNDEDKKKVKLYAGVSHDHKGRLIPIAAGRLCIWKNDHLNPRNWLNFISFRWFKINLKLNCQVGNPYLLEWTPNGTIPDVVYYHVSTSVLGMECYSFRQRNMGYKIHLVDVVRPSSASSIGDKFTIRCF